MGARHFPFLFKEIIHGEEVSICFDENIYLYGSSFDFCRARSFDKKVVDSGEKEPVFLKEYVKRAT